MSQPAMMMPQANLPSVNRDSTWAGVMVIVVTCFATGLLESVIAARPVRCWQFEVPPVWPPPAAFLGPLWGVAFALMVLSSIVVWLARNRTEVLCPLITFSIQMLVGVAWTILFFGLQHPMLGLINGIALWIVLGHTMVQFCGVSRIAGWLLTPYWAWVTCAVVLNGSIGFAMV